MDQQVHENFSKFHTSQVPKLTTFINRSHILIHSTSLIFFFIFRASFIFQQTLITPQPLLLSSLFFTLFFAELVLSLQWLFGQASRWRPLRRTSLPENIPATGDCHSLPALDVFICTVDSEKEPIETVMNTVLSAMAMDYPPEKLAVYISDDGGSPAVLAGAREAWGVAKIWVPFCRRFKVQNPCPQAFFYGDDHDDDVSSLDEFVAEKERVKREYEAFKDRVGKKKKDIVSDGENHPAFLEVMKKSCSVKKIPILVYVSREKKPSRPHHFKAGALNVLTRISGVTTNAPYILVLDCDMYCNDASVTRRAMCFHLDPTMSSSLAFVQFPQKFHNISAKNDIYDSQFRTGFPYQWQGLDGIGGPILCGTCFFMKRLALCEFNNSTDHSDLMKLRHDFGPSNEFVKSLGNQTYNPTNTKKLLNQEMKLLASSTFEVGTKWGEEVGFLYGSVVEDYLTGLALQCKGWKSVYCDPPRPQFLGCGVTTLNDSLVQYSRWTSGLLDVGISKYCPFVYGFSKLSLLQIGAYMELVCWPIWFFPVWCFATIPQLCLLNGVLIYPQVNRTLFTVTVFVFFSASSKYLYEVVTSGGTFQSYMNEHRIWMMRSLTSCLYGTIDTIFKRFGLWQPNFRTTNKATGRESHDDLLYQKGLYDFRAPIDFLVPIVSLVILNLASFLVGIRRAISGEVMLVQIFLSFYVLVMSYPIIEGMFVRKDKGCVPFSATVVSALCCLVLGVFVSVLFFH